MLLLVTGASGAGKSTARRLAEPHLPSEIVCAELYDLVEIPAAPDIRWRQESTEQAVRYALSLQENGNHLLLAGDPVAIGEVLATPSATRLEKISACLLDVNADAQAARLTQRGDDPSLLVHHLAFAEWMRGHVRDPRHRQFVIVEDGWEEMRWERWTGWASNDPRWQFEEIDTSDVAPGIVAERLTDWCRRVLASDAPALRGKWWE